MIFDDFFTYSTSSLTKGYMQKYHLVENTDEKTVWAVNVAGIPKKNLSVHTEDNSVFIKGESDEDSLIKQKIDYYYKVPTSFESVSSKYEDGMLYITIEKTKEKNVVKIE